VPACRFVRFGARRQTHGPAFWPLTCSPEAQVEESLQEILLINGFYGFFFVAHLATVTHSSGHAHLWQHDGLEQDPYPDDDKKPQYAHTFPFFFGHCSMIGDD
jgi:hypothetical protein